MFEFIKIQKIKKELASLGIIVPKKDIKEWCKGFFAGRRGWEGLLGDIDKYGTLELLGMVLFFIKKEKI